MKKSELQKIIREELQKLNEYNNKDELLNAFFGNKISVKELDKLADEQFGTKIATKSELTDFLKNTFMQDIMADIHGLPKSTIIKKVKELMKYV